MDAALAEGDAAIDRDDPKRALTAYQRAKRLAPNDPAPLTGIARATLAGPDVTLELGSDPKSRRVLGLLPELERARTLDAKYAPAERELGKALFVLGRAEPAEAALSRAVALEPNDLEAVSLLAVVLIATGQSARALPHLRHAVALEPSSAEPETNLGTALLLLDRAGEAAEAFERAVALDPGSARTHSDLGAACLAQGRLERAVSELTRATELAPDRATYRSNLAHALELAGNLDLALTNARRATELDPKLGSAWIVLGTVSAKLGRYAASRQAFERARALDPTDPRVPANLDELNELEHKH
jgi:Flp pilus assembly protein TadD